MDLKISNKLIVIVTLGTLGDIFPFISLAKIFIDKEIVFITNPFYKKIIIENGFKFHPLGKYDEMVSLLNDKGLWCEKKGFNSIWRHLASKNIDTVIDFISKISAQKEIILFSGLITFPIAASAKENNKNIKVVMCYLSPSNIRSNFDSINIGNLKIPASYPSHLKKRVFDWVDRNYFDIDTISDINSSRKRIDLEPIYNFIPFVQNSADLYLTLFPHWLSSPKPDWPKPLLEIGFLFQELNAQDFNNDNLENFLIEKKSPILFTFGSGNSQETNFFRIAYEVVRKLNKNAIFLTKTLLPNSIKKSENIFVLKYFPIEFLLNRCSLIVHHGGIGTLATAIKFAIPQLIIPTSHDQFCNARIINELEIGEKLAYEELDVEKLLFKLNQIAQSSKFKSNSISFSEKIKLTTNQGPFLDALYSILKLNIDT